MGITNLAVKCSNLQEDEELFPSWVDTEIGSYDVYSVRFSPNFADDDIITAVASDQDHTYVAYNYGISGNWNLVELLDASNTGFDINGASNICPVPDFTEPYQLFVGVVGGDGGIYEVDEDHAERLNDIGADIISLDLTMDSGTLRLLAGENDSAQVWASSDGGENWEVAAKPPSGGSQTYVVMANDFAHSGQAYAATSGSESAVSVSRDGGANWNQTGLIDTEISTIIDLAPSPNFSLDNTLFLLTWGGQHSLWRSQDGAISWERAFSSALPDVDNLSLVSLPPEYGNGSQVVYLTGTRNGSPTLWKSTDSGQSFTYHRTTPLTVDVWTVANDTSLFLGGYDSSNGLVYRTTKSGQSYLATVVIGSTPLSSIVLSPGYESDKTILVGSTSGWVYWSNDNGDSLEPLPPDATSPPLSGVITVAFDPDFTDNQTVYAASDNPDEGIYRFTIGTSTAWENIDHPAGGMMGQIVVSDSGTLYAANFKIDGGVERSLNPTYALGPTFETVTRGLDSGATLTKLWRQNTRLWSIDTNNVRLVALTDSLTMLVSLVSPDDEAAGVGTLLSDTIKDVELDWETLDGATEYEWQLDDDTDFSATLFSGNTKASSERLSALESATTYYWRVRANEPVLSPWSEKWSFTTAMGSEATTPRLISPEAGGREVALRPVFQWSAVAGAESYEIIVSTKDSLDNPVVLKTGDYAIPNTAWECNIKLDYGTTYYWKVRAVSAETYSAWSAVSAFTTIEGPTLQDESSPPPEPPSPPEPASSSKEPPANTIPDWMKYLLGALLAAVITLSAIVLVLVRRIK